MYIDIVYETKNAIFKFLLPDVKARLSYYAYEHGAQKTKDLISFLISWLLLSFVLSFLPENFPDVQFFT